VTPTVELDSGRRLVEQSPFRTEGVGEARRVFSFGKIEPRSILLMSPWSMPVFSARSIWVRPRSCRRSIT
jgi:hypothetical protein